MLVVITLNFLYFSNLYLSPLVLLPLPLNLLVVAACFLGCADLRQACYVAMVKGELILYSLVV